MISLTLFVTAIYHGLIHHDPQANLYTNAIFWGLFWPFFIFITTPLFGKVFCAVCPHRLLIFSVFSNFSKKNKAPLWMTNGYVSLFLLIVFYWVPFYAFPDIFHDPFFTAVYFIVFTIAAILVTLWYRADTWCAGVCPIAIATNILARVSIFGLRTKKDVCDACKKATCVSGRLSCEGCPHKLNPSRLTNNSDCVLCMKCIAACDKDSIVFVNVSPMGEFRSNAPGNKKAKASSAPRLNNALGARRRTALPEALATLMLFGALTFTMQFYKGFSHGSMKGKSPFIGLAALFEPLHGGVLTPDGAVAFLTFVFCVSFCVGYYFFFSWLTARRFNRSTKDLFCMFAWSALPIFALSGFAQMSEFFFYRYYPMISNGIFEFINYPAVVRPLAQMNALWLLGFKLISITGSVWSMVLAWDFSANVSLKKSERIRACAPFVGLAFLTLIGFIAHVAAIIFLNLPEISGPTRF